jgi:hypothetical protein
MHTIYMRARFMLQEGCPLVWEGKPVTYVRTAVDRLGPLNVRGRPMGLYIDPNFIIVRLEDGEEMSVATDSCRTVPASSGFVTQVFEEMDTENRYLGPLEHPPQFYPGDIIEPKIFPGERWRVLEVRYRDESGEPEYECADASGSTVALDIEFRLVKAGNVHLLYADPYKLEFQSDEEELLFWAQKSISDRRLGRVTGGQSLWACADAFRRGQADLILPVQRKPFFSTHELCPAFVEHRERVRTVTERLYGALMTEEIERVAHARQDTTD